MIFKIRKARKRDLLEVSDAERLRMLNKAKAALRQSVVEAKLWKRLVEVEELVVNGEPIIRETDHLASLLFEGKL